MVQTRNSSGDGGSSPPDPIAAQLAAIAAKLDTILASLRDDIEEIKLQVMGDGCNSEKSEGDLQNMVAEGTQGSEHDPIQQLGSGIDDVNINSGVCKIVEGITAGNDVSDDGIHDGTGIDEVDETDGTGIEDWGAVKNLTAHGSFDHVVGVIQLAQSSYREFTNLNILGDQLYLKVLPLKTKNEDLKEGLALTGKLLLGFYGPPLTVIKVGSVTCELALPSGSRLHPVLYVSMFHLVPVRRQPHKIPESCGVQDAGQPTIEWLIAWYYYYWVVDLRTSRFSGPEVLMQTY